MLNSIKYSKFLSVALLARFSLKSEDPVLFGHTAAWLKSNSPRLAVGARLGGVRGCRVSYGGRQRTRSEPISGLCKRHERDGQDI